MSAQEPKHVDSLAFLAPGLLHQLGNLLLTIQGNAHCMAETAAPRERQAILAASVRGAAALGVLRQLLGDGTRELAPVDRLFAQVLELSRTSLREAGHTLLDATVDCGAGAPTVVAAPFVRAFTGLLGAFVAHVPAGVQIRIEPGLECRHGGIAVWLDRRRDTGELPFPLPLDDLMRGLSIDFAAAGLPGRVVRRPDGIALSLVSEGGSDRGVATAGTFS